MVDVKKGKPSWKPASAHVVHKKLPGYVYRWCSKNPEILQRRQLDGWQYATKVHGDTATREQGDHADLTSVTEHRERVLMCIPEEDYQAHRDYFKRETAKQSAGLKRKLQEDLREGAKGPGAVVHGDIIIP